MLKKEKSGKNLGAAASIDSTVSNSASADAATLSSSGTANSSQVPLQAGDIVYFMNSRERRGGPEDGYLHSEGFLDTRLGMIWKREGAKPDNFRECLFRVCTQLTYKASKARTKLERSQSATADQLEFLKEQMDKEKESNANIIETLTEAGMVFNYGTILQLQHLKSKKFVTLVSRTLADMDKECMKMELVDGGSHGSWFKFRPRFKNRVDGRPVFFGDQATLQTVKLEMNVHISEIKFTDDPLEREEANISNDLTGLRIMNFSESVANSAKYLSVGEAIRIFHPESDSVLSASSNPFKEKSPYLFRKRKEADDDIDDPSNLVAKSLFFVEGPTVNVGGVVRWRCKYRLRHIASGRYLAVETVPIAVPEDSDGVDTGACYRPVLVASAQDPRTIFRFHPVETPLPEDDGNIPEENLSMFLENVMQGKRGSVTSLLGGSREESVWLHNSKVSKGLDNDDLRANLKVNFCSARLDEDSLNVYAARPWELEMAEEIAASVPLALSYCAALKRRLTAQREAGKREFVTYLDMALANKMLTRIVFMTTNDEEMEAAGKPMEAEGLPKKEAQQMVRELKLIDALFAMLRAPEEAGLTLDDLTKDGFQPLLETHRLIFKTITQCFLKEPRNELYVTTSKVSSFDPTVENNNTYIMELSRQLGQDLGAADCLKELISYNYTLLSEKIDFQSASIFVELIRKKGPVQEYIMFLEALCDCQGRTVYQNQELLLRVMYSAGRETKFIKNRAQLMVETCMDTTAPGRPFTPSGDVPARFFGDDIMKNGLRDIYVSWTCSPDWSSETEEEAFYVEPEALKVQWKRLPTPPGLAEYEARAGETHERRWIKLDDIAWACDAEDCYENAFPGRSWEAYNKILEENKEAEEVFILTREVMEYYTQMLEFYASLARGRSYHCINALTKQFSYEMLVSGMVNTRLPDLVRGAFASLVLSLYVDRFPHETLELPQLVRVYDNIRKESLLDAPASIPKFHLPDESPIATSDDPFLSYPDANKFFILQDVINQHLIACGGRQIIADVDKNRMTTKYLEVTESLLRYGFFDNVNQLKALINPLVSLMDGRADIMDKDEEGIAGPHLGGGGNLLGMMGAGLGALGGAGLGVMGAGVGAIGGGLGALGGGLGSGFGKVGSGFGKVGSGFSGMLSGVGTKIRSASGAAETKDDVEMTLLQSGGSQASESGRLSTATEDEITDILPEMETHKKPQKKRRRTSVSQLAAAAEGEENGDGGMRSMDRYILDVEQLVVTQAKRLICDALAAIDTMQLNYRLMHVLSDLKDARSNKPLVQTLRAGVMPSRVTLNGETVEVKLTKMEMMEEMDSDWQTWLTSEGITKLVSLFPGRDARPDIRMLDVEYMSEMPIATSCLDLMMYEDPRIFEGALETLIRNFNHHERLVDAVTSVQLLVSADAVRANQVLEKKLSVLRTLLDSYETWGIETEFSSINNENFDLVLSIFAELAELCRAPRVEESKDDADTIVPSKTNQDLLRNMNVHEVAIKALSLPSNDKNDKNHLRILKASNSFIMMFMLEHTENQVLMFQHIDQFLTMFGSGTGVSRAIAQMFKDNRALCEEFPEEILWHIANQIERDGHMLRFLAVFFNITAPQGAPLPRSQDMIAKVLSDPQFKRVQLVFDEGLNSGMNLSECRECVGYKERVKLMALIGGNRPGGMKRRNSSPDAIFASQEIDYHIGFVNLIALMAKGKNTATEVKAQMMLPLNHTIAVLLDERTIYSVRASFARFLHEVYFETDIAEFDRLASDPRVWELLEMWVQTLKQFLSEIERPGASLGTELGTFIIEGLLPALEGFMTNTFDPEVIGEGSSEEKTVKELVMAVMRLYRHRDRHSKFKKAIVSMAVALNQVPAEASDVLNLNEPEMSDNGQPMAANTPQAALDELCEALRHDYRVKDLAIHEFDQLAQTFLDVKKLTDPYDENHIKLLRANDPAALADPRANAITFEDLICRICRHVREDHDTSPALITKTLMVLGHIIDFKLPSNRERNPKSYVLEEEDVPNYPPQQEAEEVEAHQAIQNAMDDYGCSMMVIDLISDPAVGDDMFVATMKLTIELLEGGNPRVQNSFFEYFCSLGDSADKFFIAMIKRIHRGLGEVQSRRRIEKFKSRMRKISEVSTEEAELNIEDDKVRVDLVFRILQLFAEGHNNDMQNLLRDQTEIGVRFSQNCVLEGINYVSVLAKNDKVVRTMSGEDSLRLVSLLEFITEVMQGPCGENQLLVANSVLVDVCSSIIWVDFKIGTRISELEVSELKKAAVRVLLAMIEGRDDLVVQEILAAKLEATLIRRRMVQVHQHYLNNFASHMGDAGWDEEALEEGFDLLKLTQALSTYAAVAGSPACANFAQAMKPQHLRPSMFKSHDIYLRKKKVENDLKLAVAFLDRKMCSIEVSWGSPKPHLERIYFPLPSECDFMPEPTREALKLSVDYNNEDRVSMLVENSDDVIDEMRHIEYLNQFRIYRYVGAQLEHLKHGSFALAVVMNLLIVLAMVQPQNTGDNPKWEPEWVSRLMYVLGFTQLFTSGMVLGFLLANRAPLVYKKHMRAMKARKADAELSLMMLAEEAKKEVTKLITAVIPAIKATAVFAVFGLVIPIHFGYIPTWFIAIWCLLMVNYGIKGLREWWNGRDEWVPLLYCIGFDVCSNPDTLFYIIYLVAAGLGLLWRPYFYTYHLLDIVIMSDTLKNVVRAVTQPGKALTLTAVLGLITIYIFALFGFYFFPASFWNEDEGTNMCDTMLKCFGTFLRNGLMYGGGIGDYIGGDLGHMPDLDDNAEFVARTAYDLMFFIVVLILLLNIIFGIIIDTFGSLRESDQEREHLMKSQCFVCRLPKEDFDAAANKLNLRKGFEKHIASEHHMWNYLYFIAYLKHKPETDYTGAETYVTNLIKNQDLSWFPNERALALEDAE